jgi:hypothetical protein
LVAKLGSLFPSKSLMKTGEKLIDQFNRFSVLPLPQERKCRSIDQPPSGRSRAQSPPRTPLGIAFSRGSSPRAIQEEDHKLLLARKADCMCLALSSALLKRYKPMSLTIASFSVSPRCLKLPLTAAGGPPNPASAGNTIGGARRKWLMDSLLSPPDSDGPVARGCEINVLGGS